MANVVNYIDNFDNCVYYFCGDVMRLILCPFIGFIVRLVRGTRFESRFSNWVDSFYLDFDFFM